MEFDILLSFIGASLILIVMPGPDNIFVLTQSLSGGVKTGVAITTGLCSGIIIHTIAAATGLSIILQTSAIAFSVVKYLGAAYLLYMAFIAIKEKRLTVDVPNNQDSQIVSVYGLIRKGFFMNLLNPKVSLFFIAFLPQFISSNGFRPSFQLVILGAIFMILSWLSFSLIALLSGKLSEQLNSTKFWNCTKWTKVVVLSVLGITLALSKK